MRVLVLGGTGMLGHKVWAVLAARFETYATVRRPDPAAANGAGEFTVTGVSVDDLQSVERAITSTRPDVVVNCIGIVKQLAAGKSAIPSIEVNALFPHRLAEFTDAAEARLIQISTDCVFSGRKGHYSEADEPDPVDLYGHTKLLGETSYEHTLTIRTSIVGRELTGAHGLLEWFLAQEGSVRGFRRAIFSGLTTGALADTLARLIEAHRDLSGVWHVAAEPIDKHALLQGFARAYDKKIEIEPDDALVIDRSLDDSRFRDVTGIPRPTWCELLDQLAADRTPYEELRAVAC